ncbi:MAG: hypothetical protein ACSHYA_08250 [Opitutaceae bacterium]
MRLLFIGLVLGVIVGSSSYFTPSASEGRSEVEVFVDFLLEDPERFESVAFRDVVEAVSDCKLLPIDQSDAIDREMLKAVEQALDRVFEELAASSHSIHAVGRVNEISRHLENTLLSELDSVDGYQCAIPVNASGELQRSGYPDLRLLHEASGRIFYLDPKVYKQGSESSSFRTFYFEPKRETNKILDDATHLIVGIAHGGKVDGQWKLNSWQLIDLYNFRVRLKAEFQASNRDLYQEAAQVLKSN